MRQEKAKEKRRAAELLASAGGDGEAVGRWLSCLAAGAVECLLHSVAADVVEHWLKGVAAGGAERLLNCAAAGATNVTLAGRLAWLAEVQACSCRASCCHHSPGASVAHHTM